MTTSEHLVESVSTILHDRRCYEAYPDEITAAIESKDLMRMRGLRQCAARDILIGIYIYMEEDRCREILSETMTDGYGVSQLMQIAIDQHLWHVCEKLELFEKLCMACHRQEKAEFESALNPKS